MSAILSSTKFGIYVCAARLIQVYFRPGVNFRHKTDKSVVPSFAAENGASTAGRRLSVWVSKISECRLGQSQP